MEKIHENMHVFMLHVFMYFLHLVPTFPPWQHSGKGSIVHVHVQMELTYCVKGSLKFNSTYSWYSIAVQLVNIAIIEP